VCLLLFLVTGSLAALLFRYYWNISWEECLLEGFVIALIWGVLFYYSWYVSLYVKYWPAKVITGAFLQLIPLFLYYVLFVPAGFVDEWRFIQDLPFMVITGGLGWVIVMQWYATQVPEDPLAISDLPPPEVEPVPEVQAEVLQTLPVKDGSRIHIIPVEEIFYVQACGDYVNIFTADGQFLKEQTMKSLEASLPLSFIRIHRSTLINSAHLLRIELFGKENYHIQLKNGASLKASLTGYKLLKSRLNL